jgi:hypothetical protein
VNKAMGNFDGFEAKSKQYTFDNVNKATRDHEESIAPEEFLVSIHLQMLGPLVLIHCQAALLLPISHLFVPHHPTLSHVVKLSFLFVFDRICFTVKFCGLL